MVTYIRTEEHKKLMSERLKGHKISQETRDKISKANKGKNIGKHHTEEAKQKISKKLKGKYCGEKAYFFGKHHTKETKEKISKANKGKKLTKKHKENIKKNHANMKGKNSPLFGKTGNLSPRYGIKHSKETKNKMSLAQKGKPKYNQRGEKHHNWKGGISKEPYSFDFDEELKELIRKRDNYTCQFCGKQQREFKKKLSIHHIDYNKQNTNPKNLVSLCNICHQKTNFKRKDWKNIFRYD